MSRVYRTSNCEQLTIASRRPPTPLSIGHAGMSVDSLQSVPSVTGVGHCGSKSCTRVDLSTICRSIRGRTTADGCRGDTVQLCLYIAVLQLHEIQHKKRHAVEQRSRKNGKSRVCMESKSFFWVYLFTLVLARTADEMYGLCH